MVITEHGDRDQIAVLEENMLVQHYVTRRGSHSMVGNVYMGRIQNVLPGMEAAFVDIGRGRNGVLYAGEVNYSPEDLEGGRPPRIERVLKSGQAVMVQVTKDPMGGKGARLTAQVSLPGRFLVLAPDQDVSGISRRLSDDARKRLKSILNKVKPKEHGVIVRTAAEGASEEEITHDLQRLIALWEQIQKTAKKVKAPDVLYEEPELTVRVVRDLFTDEEFRGLVTDSDRVYEKVMDYVRDVAPDLASKVTLHRGPLSAFEEHRIVEQIHKALDRKVWLPSGGYLIIEQTEAMTIVDVNTGKAVGKTNLEETVLTTNLEAAREVARQLRLRDIGGIIVIDFIDLLLEQNKRKVEDTMREALAIDKTRSQVFEIGPLGIMQITRKRVSGGLVDSFSETCPHMRGARHHRDLRRELTRRGEEPAMYAVIKTGGKQHKVQVGDVIEIEKLVVDGETVEFHPLLVVDDDGKTHVGAEAAKAVVVAKPLGEKKGEKVKVFKYRPKSGYARKAGHRQLLTMLEITDVKLPTKRAAAKTDKDETGPPRRSPTGEKTDAEGRSRTPRMRQRPPSSW